MRATVRVRARARVRVRVKTLTLTLALALTRLALVALIDVIALGGVAPGEDGVGEREVLPREVCLARAAGRIDAKRLRERREPRGRRRDLG